MLDSLSLWLHETPLGETLLTMLISMLPVVELRGGLPAGVAMGLPIPVAFIAWGLLIFVAIPLPGTGAWTGALIAAVLNMRLKRAVPVIFLGVVIAGCIITLLTHGVTLLF